MKDRIDKFLQGEDYRAMYLKVRDELAELQQRTWVGLTADEQSFIYDQVKQIVNSKPFWVRFADAIEAKIKEKNT